MSRDKNDTKPFDLAVIRARLAGLRGQLYWRSLEELAETGEFQECLHREFPSQSSGWETRHRRSDWTARNGGPAWILIIDDIDGEVLQARGRC